MADSPKWAEAAQAVFSAVLDYEGKTFDPAPANYTAFKKKYGKVMQSVDRNVKHPGVTLRQIEQNLEKDQDWYDSSINIANAVFTQTKNIARKTHNKIKPSGIELFYLRDEGRGSVMGSIKDIYTHVNNTVKKKNRDEGTSDLTFNDLNKWSPADIYIASEFGKKLLAEIASGRQLITPYKLGKTHIISLNNFMTFGVFNALIRKLIIQGNLMPLSLKKAPGQVKIKTINFLPGDVSRALEVKDVRYHGYTFAKTRDVYNSKDVYIKITDQHALQFRDKGGTGGGLAPVHSYQAIITGGKQALDGSMAGDAIGMVLGQTLPSAGKFFKGQNIKRVILEAKKITSKMFHDMEVDTFLDDKTIDNEICNKVYEYAKKYTSGIEFGTKKEFFETLYNHDEYSRQGTMTKKGVANAILTQRAISQFLFGKYLGGKLITFLEGTTEKKRNDMVISLVLYAGSRTNRSSPHFKASDISSF